MSHELPTRLFSNTSQAFIYNIKENPIQSMLDFDFVSRRKIPSVAGLIKPGATHGTFLKFFFGKKEILIPVFSTIKDATSKFKNADVFINFASYRSAFESSMEAMSFPTIRTVVIIAEGIPEIQSKKLIAYARAHNKTIIGPATVGAVQAGAFKIGYAGGPVENVMRSKLYKPGSVGLVTKSGGLSNEMYNVLSTVTDGLYEGIAIGGDYFPGSTLFDHVLRFEKIPEVKIIVVLGELGGINEYDIVEALRSKRVTKPLVAWVPGTCAKVFPTEVQFGHAGAKSGGIIESAEAKNSALAAVGAIVPNSFEEFSTKISETYNNLITQGLLLSQSEGPLPEKIPQDYKSAVKNGKIRRPTSFVSTICDDRGDEPTYAGVSVTELIRTEQSIGDVIGLLWFKRKLPEYASRFIDICIILTADHGPCVSGAHNTIVCARAGKDLVSSVASGLLTIGPRYGGAIDDAARQFKYAIDEGLTPENFVEGMKRKGLIIPGIGHRIKTVNNPDMRVVILKEYAKEHFGSVRHLTYALEVEKYTLQKSPNLILNVDGAIASLFLDLMESSQVFSKFDVQQILETGGLNGLFILARTIGLIGHCLDQKRLQQPLYRHPWDDVLYHVDENGASGQDKKNYQ